MRSLVTKGCLLMLLASANVSGAEVTAIDLNDRDGAWVGFNNGKVLFCNAGGGTVAPFWSACAQAVAAGGPKVTAIAAQKNWAWVGFIDGSVRYCKERGLAQRPEAICDQVDTK